MSFLIFKIIFSSRIHYIVNSGTKYDFKYGYFVYEVKISQNLRQRRNAKIYMCSDTLNGKNLGKICATLQWHRPLRYVNGQF